MKKENPIHHGLLTMGIVGALHPTDPQARVTEQDKRKVWLYLHPCDFDVPRDSHPYLRWFKCVPKKLPLLLFTLLIIGCDPNPDLPNFAVVDNALYLARGGQPTNRGFDQLKALGIAHIIKLNTESEGSDDYAKSIGLDVVSVPITLTEQLSKVPEEKLRAALLHLGANTYVHCEHGQDRTGLVIALYRLQRNHWTKRDAESEMMKLGFHPALHGLHEAWENAREP